MADSNSPQNSVQTAASRFRKAVDSIETKGQSDNLKQKAAWLVSASDYIQDGIATIDFAFTSADDLELIESEIENASTEVEQFLAEPTKVQQISNAEEVAKQAIQRIAVTPRLTQSSKAIERGIREFNRSIDAATQLANDSVQALAAKLDRIRDEVTVTDDAAASVSKEIKEMEKRIQDALDDFEQAFGEFQEASRTKFDVQLTELEKSFDARTSSKLDELEEGAKETLGAIKGVHDEASRLLKATSSVVLAGEYGKVAGENKASADWLRGLAILAFSAMVGSVTAIAFQTDEFEWPIVLLRILTVALISLPALYIARESTHHRNESVRNRRIQVELAALRPFISEFPADRQRKLEEKLLDRYFVGQSDSETIPDDD